MIFINTRPPSRAKLLTEFLRSQHIDVIDLPLLELVAKPLDPNEQQALNRITHAKVVILVSEEAVKYGLMALANNVDLAQIAQLPITWIAVGQKTAEHFGKLWQRLSDAPPPAVIFPSDNTQQNNEGLLKLPEITSLKRGDSVQLWRGVGGRELLADTLIVRGITVNMIHFYQRILPTSTLQRFFQLQENLLHHSPISVLVTSLTAWQHWQTLIQHHFKPTDFKYIVLQQRIATLMRQDDNDIRLTVIDDLQPLTILTHLAITTC